MSLPASLLSPPATAFGKEAQLEKSEWLAVLVILALSLVLNCLTAELGPIESHDEVLLSEAGMNLYFGQGFTSGAWPAQRISDFYSGNLPLYPLALAGWFHVVGFSFLKWHLFSNLAGAVGGLLAWLGLRRLGLLKSKLGAIVFVALFFFTGPGFYAVRMARYDPFQMLLMGALVWCFSWSSPHLRRIGIFILGALLTASGLQVVVVAFLLGMAVWMRKEWSARAEVICLGAGLICGGVAVASLWAYHHAFAGFLENVRWTRELEQEDGGRLWKAWVRLVVDPAKELHLPLLAVLLLLVCRTPRWVRFGTHLAVVAAVAVALQVTIHFRGYYHWVAAAPLVFFIAQEAEAVRWRLNARLWAGGAILAALLLVGPVKSLFLGWAMDLPGQHEALRVFAREHLTGRDIVFTEHACCTAVKPVVARSFFDAYRYQMPPEEVRSITALLLRPEGDGVVNGVRVNDVRGFFNQNGAQWDEVAAVPPPNFSPIMKWLRARSKVVDAYLGRRNAYQVTLYRRRTAP